MTESSVTAIDVLLDPDGTMIDHATKFNERLLESFPAGFSLDDTHQPHITLLQRFVRTADLEAVYASLEQTLRTEHPEAWTLRAVRSYYMPSESIGLAGIVVEPTADMIRLQQKVIDAVSPYTVATGTDDAFVTTAEDPTIIPALLDYVRDFVPSSCGENYHPHVTTGVSTRVFLDQLLAEPFEEFSFSPIAASVYKLGNYGTASELLKSWSFAA